MSAHQQDRGSSRRPSSSPVCKAMPLCSALACLATYARNRAGQLKRHSRQRPAYRADLRFRAHHRLRSSAQKNVRSRKQRRYCAHHSRYFNYSDEPHKADKVRESWPPDPSPPPISDTEHYDGPFQGSFFFAAQRGLAKRPPFRDCQNAQNRSLNPFCL